jgi:unsaturated rhamnogalacturonyl hydrolase
MARAGVAGSSEPGTVRTNSGGAGRASGAIDAGSTGSWCLPLSQHPLGIDWAKALVDSQKSASLGWFYSDGLFLHGVYLAYKRLNDPSYLAMIQKWADAHLDGAAPYNSLDDMQPAWVLLDMYRETKDPKYTTTPTAIANRLETTYPKTSDGGFWHRTNANNQLWGDGVFMDLPQYVSYGEQLNHPQATDAATQQLIVYDGHLQAPNNLHVHQWDGAAMRQSCCEWCRAEGWYEMALLIVLDVTPPTHANYNTLVSIVQRLAKGLAATQDQATGRWWQVMDRPNDSANWLETSCTAMHTYFLSKASQKGYIDAATYAPLAIKGFRGAMEMVSNSSSPSIQAICPGTDVLGSAAEYEARPKATNDNHGLGAFLLMYDQLTCR